MFVSVRTRTCKYVVHILRRSNHIADHSKVQYSICLHLKLERTVPYKVRASAGFSLFISNICRGRFD